MLDPVSIGLAISTASKAFDMIQRGFAVGRELEQMHGDMGRWMSATAEIAATAEDAENAGFITRMLKGSGNIEQIATQAVLAKKQIEKQRYELMVHVRMRWGMKTWEDILKAEGQLRKAKAKALEEQRKFMERSVLIVVLTTIIGGGLFALWNWADYLKAWHENGHQKQQIHSV
jgi:CRISPR/Cas system CSM-associated protein Csm2 small subunit